MTFARKVKKTTGGTRYERQNLRGNHGWLV